jgi:uncharacterized membrane-anchored protein
MIKNIIIVVSIILWLIIGIVTYFGAAISNISYFNPLLMIPLGPIGIALWYYLDKKANNKI